MKKFLLSISVFASATLGFSQCTDLFFSEYIEGTSNNKAFEVYNPTSGTIDLSNYHIVKFANGTSTPNDTLWMAGMLPSGQTYNVVNPAADSLALEVFADTTGTITFYNGNDPLFLYHGSVLIDVIGDTLGNPTGDHWVVSTGFTNEFTLVRKQTIFSGTTTWQLFGDTQWDVYPQNDYTHFNAHTMDACPAGSGIENETGWDVSIYPNPSSGHLSINSEVDNYSVQVIDLTGKIILNKNNASETTQIDLSNMPNGIYMVKLNNGSHQLTKKIIIRK